MKNVRKSDDDFPLMQVTPAYTVYNSALKAIVVLSTKLCITPENRIKFGINNNDEKEGNDGF